MSRVGMVSHFDHTRSSPVPHTNQTSYKIHE